MKPSYTKPITDIGENNGYEYFMDRNHPLADRVGRVYLHRHVGSLKAGHWLTPDEHVHHLDENKKNNTPENLVVVTQREHMAYHHDLVEPRACLACSKTFTPHQDKIKHCSARCAHKSQEKISLTRKDLEKLVFEMSLTAVGKKYGVTGNAIKKRCIKMGVKWPEPGYWVRYENGCRPKRTPRVYKPKPLVHGNNGYDRKCRCSICSEAHSERMREYKNKRGFSSTAERQIAILEAEGAAPSIRSKF